MQLLITVGDESQYEIVFLLIQMIIVLFIICSYAREKVSIIKEASFLDDFCVDKETGTVTINCSVTIKNECNDMNLCIIRVHS